MRFNIYFLIGFLVLTTFWGCTNSGDDSDDVKVAGWTYLFYNDADFTNGYDPTKAFVKEMYGGENINVLILRDIHKGNTSQCNSFPGRDAGNSDAAIYRIDGKIEVSTLKELGEVDMGACVDDTDKGWLNMWEIKEALKANGGVDLVLYTAPCLMGTIGKSIDEQ